MPEPVTINTLEDLSRFITDARRNHTGDPLEIWTEDGKKLTLQIEIDPNDNTAYVLVT